MSLKTPLHHSYSASGSLKGHGLLGFLGEGIWKALMKFIQQIFTEHPLCARPCLRAGEITENKTEKNLCLHGADILVGGGGENK